MHGWCWARSTWSNRCLWRAYPEHIDKKIKKGKKKRVIRRASRIRTCMINWMSCLSKNKKKMKRPSRIRTFMRNWIPRLSKKKKKWKGLAVLELAWEIECHPYQKGKKKNASLQSYLIAKDPSTTPLQLRARIALSACNRRFHMTELFRNWDTWR